MKAIITLGFAAMLFGGCSSDRQSRAHTNLVPSLRPYVTQVANELHTVPGERKAVLDEIVRSIVSRLDAGKPAQLTFICTHNSRRSHMSQIWAMTAAYHYGLDKVSAYSGGTEATACNCRTVTALRRAGFDITDATAGDNPVYLVR